MNSQHLKIQGVNAHSTRIKGDDVVEKETLATLYTVETREFDGSFEKLNTTAPLVTQAIRRGLQVRR